MKFKTDENMPAEAAQDLRQAGHDAFTVAKQTLPGKPDTQVADACKTEGRIILTMDVDFSDIRAYSPPDCAGIVVLRPSVQTVPNIRRLVAQVIALLTTEPLPGHLWIVDEGQIRIRAGTKEQGD